MRCDAGHGAHHNKKIFVCVIRRPLLLYKKKFVFLSKKITNFIAGDFLERFL